MRRLRESSRGRSARKGLVLYMCVAILASCFPGCRTRSDYRRWADLEVANIVQQRECNPLWDVPERPVTPDPQSRMADFNAPDCGALPPDDPAAHSFMHCADCRAGWPHWHDRGDLPSIEFPDWKNYLSMDEEGVVVLTRENVMDLALRHSRDYQDQVEQLYFSALALTLNRFDFSHQWFGRSSIDSNITGNGAPFGSESLAIANGFGFSKNLTTGGQLLANLANSFVWEFAGDDISMASTGVLFSLAQPLLRGAFREVRMEPLTQAERDVLYSLRDFARFRRAFYVDVIGGNGFLGLLEVSQAIKNQRANLESLEKNLEEHEQLLIGGLVSPIQVDQIFQQYQQGRLNLLSAEQALEATLDQFKQQLGLPPQLDVRLDEDALSPFELSSDELDELTDENETLRLELLQFDEQPPNEFIEKGLNTVESQIERLKKIHGEIESDWKTWSDRQADRKEPADENEKETFEREKKLSKRLKEILDGVMDDLEEDGPRIEKAIERLDSGYTRDDDEDDFMSDDADAKDVEDAGEDSDEDDLLDDEPGDDTDGEAASRRGREVRVSKLSRAELIRRIERRVAERRNSKIRPVDFEGEILLIQDSVLNADEVDSAAAGVATDRNEAVFQLEGVTEKGATDATNAADAAAQKAAAEEAAAEEAARKQLKKDLEELDRELEALEAESKEPAGDPGDPDGDSTESELDADDDLGDLDDVDNLDDNSNATSDNEKDDSYDNLLGDTGKDEDDADEKERKAIIAKETPWEALQELVGSEFRKHVTELFVVQNQIRVFLIQVNDLEMDSDEAVARAILNRLDLMNQRAIVVDTHRQVEVAADQLEADLGLRLEAELGTDPGRANPARFDASANRYRAGFEFDSPLTRLQERNQYRVAQINHQRARRDFMELKDNIAAQVRADIRALRLNRFRFEISRQSLIVAARQVDQAQLNLRGAGSANSNLTRDLLTALQSLLDSKNNLIQSWVNYETSRMNLFRDLEQMNISSDGIWQNEYNDSSAQAFASEQQFDDGFIEGQFDDQFEGQQFDDQFDGDGFQPVEQDPSATLEPGSGASNRTGEPRRLEP